MKLNNTVLTLALVGVLALAALAGGLLPAGNPVHAQAVCDAATTENCPPAFAAETDTREIEENTPPGVNIGAPVTATDLDEDGDADDREFGETLTYSLEGADADSFNIDPQTGHLSTKAPLDYEAHSTPSSAYSVTVRVRDSRGETDTIIVTIAITDDATEPPFAPAAPTVVSGADDAGTTDADESTTTLKVVWHPPENMGDRAIISYAYRYRSTTDGRWSVGATTVTDPTATISSLRANTTYLVSVRATSAEGTSPWSLSGTGSTNKTGNRSPTFGTTTLFSPTVPENSPGGQNVDLPIAATDSDTGALSYRLEGPDAAKFDFITSSGQIRTKRGVTYNHEDPGCGYVDGDDPTTCTYYVTVAAFDGAGGSDAVRVQIGVSDRPEAPSKPAPPTVRPTERTITSLDVQWNPPANAGPPITGYNVQYRRRGSNDNFSSGGVPDTTVGDDDTTVAGTSTMISGVDATNADTPWLVRGTSYEVRVQAVNGEGSSLWSDHGTGSTNLGNLEPVFRDRPPSGDGSARGTALSLVRTLDENTSPGRPVDRPVNANDGNADKLTYRLVAVPGSETHVTMFNINESSGQIQTKAGVAYNYEAMTASDHPCTGFEEARIRTDRCFVVTVQVRDGLNPNKEMVEEPPESPDDFVTVFIGVRNLREPPAAPIVTLTSPSVLTTLTVTWDAPTNTGPDITSYDVEYRQGSGAWLNDNCEGVTTPDNCDNITGTTTTIIGLTAGTSYSVRVRATNLEADSAWTTVTGTTNRNRPGSGTPVPNEAPSFTDPDTPLDLEVAENTASGQNIGSAVSATQGAEGDTLSYSLEGTDRNSFSIDRTNGQIKTRTSLNLEVKPSYMVRVKVVDGRGGSAYKKVTITVTDVLEPPSAPAPPRVTATRDSGLSLDVSWSAPRENKGPAVNDYDIEYREYKTGDDQAQWKSWTHGTDLEGNTDTSTTITGLDPRTAYEVRVRAKNGEGDTPPNWSNATRGTTGASNTRPAFEDTSPVVTLNVDENTRPGQNVGSPVSARDDDGHGLSYSLDGPDDSSFDINGSTGWIRTRSGVSYDYESKASYSLTVKVDDRQRKTNSVTAKSVTIELRDVDEPPSAPKAPRVTGVAGSTDSIRVSWDEPTNTGPPIDYYDVQYAQAGTGGFLQLGLSIEDSSVIITGLTPGTRYDVQVRAWNAEGHGEYSRSGTGAPNADIRNRNPRFTGGTRSFSVEENTDAGVAVGVPVTAIDDDDDPLSYSLAGTDATSFDVDAVSGQIRTREAVNFEEKSSHSVTVRARDNRGGSGTVDVRITVTDVDEPPDTPDAPIVTALSSTSLQVSWNAPGNAGPPITDYDYRHRGSTGDWTEVTNTTISATSVTIDSLTPSTFYDVAVRAKNAEGTSEWSNAGFGSTNAPGANNPPVFTEGASATRSVSATSPSGTLIGEPVAATDTDTDDTVEYSLEGPDATSFDITETNGQLRTRSGVRLTVGTDYVVTVVASDGTDAARITVTITATAAPPNRPPVFGEGASTTRTVRDDAATGASIGGPVSATDQDAGDTLTYTLEGTDEASFTIVPTSGQIRTSAALDASTKSTYSVTVRVTDGKGGSDTIAVTITVTARPVTPTTLGCGTRGAVADANNTGLVADCEALLKATAKLENGARILNWSVSRPIEEWDGISGRSGALTGTPKRVTELWLHNMGLSGTIAPELGDLSELKLLYLHRNDLTGSIPGALGDLSKLEILRLDGNQLTGQVPGELNRLSNLQRLYVHGNQLTSISDDLGAGMTQLRHLWANSNRIREIPTGLDEMPRLDWLRLDRNSLSGPIPSWLGNLSTVRRLYLHEQSGWRAPTGGLTGSIPASFGNLEKLEYLLLRRNSLSGPIPAELGRLTNLKWLGLYQNNLSGQIPSQLGALSNLERLYLHHNSLSGTVPDSLVGLSSLTNLWLRDNDLTGQIPQSLGTLPLQRVRINGTLFSGCMPAGLLDGPGRTSDAEDLNLPTCPN